mmetsp:Transcript_40468/g.114611  ORF Transcript_40468/g.114611 Transcript_40468/m.114611 type:complete len:263 (-) Transcript_40468:221-1009(-)
MVKNELWTSEEVMDLISIINSQALKRIFEGNVKKNDSMWAEIAKRHTEKFSQCVPKTQAQTRNKYDNMRRVASRYRQWKERRDGTTGGSGNGREAAEERAQPWYAELLAARSLEGPLSRNIYILHAGHTYVNQLSSRRRSIAGGTDYVGAIMELTSGNKEALSQKPIATRTPASDNGGTSIGRQGSDNRNSYGPLDASAHKGHGRPSNMDKLKHMVREQSSTEHLNRMGSTCTFRNTCSHIPEQRQCCYRDSKQEYEGGEEE